jgi:hypothetical protein
MRTRGKTCRRVTEDSKLGRNEGQETTAIVLAGAKLEIAETPNLYFRLQRPAPARPSVIALFPVIRSRIRYV